MRNLLVLVVFLSFTAALAAQDANLHASKIHPVASNLSIARYGWPAWEPDRSYGADDQVVLATTISQIQQQDERTWLYYTSAATSKGNVTVVIATRARVPYFREGMRVFWYATYLQQSEADFTDMATGKQVRRIIPVYRGELWGIRLVD